MAFRFFILFSLILGPAHSASASICESFLSGFAHSIHTSRAWKSCDPVCDIDLSRVADHFPDLTPTSKTIHSHTFYSGGEWPPNETYPDAETYTFLIPLSPTETHKIEITIKNLDSQKNVDSNHLYASGIVKALPFKTFKATRRIEVINREIEENIRHSGFSFHSGRGTAEGTIYTVNSGELLTKPFFEHLIHEHGHNVAGYISSDIEHQFFPAFWKKIVASEPGAVSDYAKYKLSEDFAETLRVYLGTTGEEHAQFRKQFPARAKALDLIFSERFGGFKNGSHWDKLKYYNFNKYPVGVSSFMGIILISLGLLYF